MSWSYTYDPHVWPALITFSITAFLGWYSWRHRNVPGAGYFAVGSLLVAIWAGGSALATSAVDLPGRVFWVKFEGVCQLPAITALTMFALSYSGLGRWLAPRNLILLAIPPLLFIALAVTNDLHHLVWRGFLSGEFVAPIRGAANWVFVGYAFSLGLLSAGVFIWLAVRSPQHRRPVAIMLLGQISGFPVYLLNAIKIDLLDPPESIFLIFAVPFSMYAIALYRFHVFDPVPLARSAVIEQMREGMLVLDRQGRIVDLNSAAAGIWGKSAANLRGQAVTAVLPPDITLPDSADRVSPAPSEISLGSGNPLRYYTLNITTLVDKSEQVLGQLLLLHEITEQKRAQAQVLEHQQVVATLQERERLARELHDGIGQVLGYVGMQAQAIQQWVRNGNTEKADALLNRLAEVAKDAHADVRECILSLKAGSPEEWSFLPTLRRYLNDFQANYGIHTDLVIEDGLKEDNFKPDAEVQLLRVIQEALNNARKHSGAQTVRVTINHGDHRGYITVADDGSGFDPGQLSEEAGTHFGLGFMRERMLQIGGRVDIDSQPGAGTVVKLEAPIWNQQEEAA